MKSLFMLMLLISMAMLMNSCIPLDGTSPFAPLPSVNAQVPSEILSGRVLRVNVSSETLRTVNASLYKDGVNICSQELDLKNGEAFKCAVQNPGTYLLKIAWKTWKIEVKKPKLQIFIWMAADNSLDNYSQYDLSEMFPLGNDISIAVSADRKDSPGSDIFFADQEGSEVLLKTVAEQDSGNIKYLEDFVKQYWVDSEKHILVIWNHGGAWLCDSLFEPTKLVSVDETSNSAFTTKDLKELLTTLKSSGYTFDALGFDACLMGSLEVLYELRGLVKYVVASPEYEPGYGWNYNFLNKGFTNLENFLKDIVLYYGDFYKSISNIYPVSLVIYDLSYIEEVASAIDYVAKNYATQTVLDYAIGARFLDYNDNSCRAPRNLKDALSSLGFIDSVKSSLNDLVYDYTTLKGGATTASIFFPQQIHDEVVEDYLTLDFSKDTKWLDFLEEMLK